MNSMSLVKMLNWDNGGIFINSSTYSPYHWFDQRKDAKDAENLEIRVLA